MFNQTPVFRQTGRQAGTSIPTDRQTDSGIQTDRQARTAYQSDTADRRTGRQIPLFHQTPVFRRAGRQAGTSAHSDTPGIPCPDATVFNCDKDRALMADRSHATKADGKRPIWAPWSCQGSDPNELSRKASSVITCPIEQSLVLSISCMHAFTNSDPNCYHWEWVRLRTSTVTAFEGFRATLDYMSHWTVCRPQGARSSCASFFSQSDGGLTA